MSESRVSRLEPILNDYDKAITKSMISTSLKGSAGPFFARIDVLDIWGNLLKEIDACVELEPEIVMDLFASVFFSYSALYKYANATLRSSLETSLRIAYFARHPVEYKWWKQDRSWQSNVKDVWGKGYEYFRSIQEVIELDHASESNSVSGIFIYGDRTIPKLYKELSKFVHTGYSGRQTKQESYSPSFYDQAYVNWAKMFDGVLSRINLLFICVFKEEAKELEDADLRKILDIGVASPPEAGVVNSLL